MTARGALVRGLAAVNAVYEDGEALPEGAVTEERIADAIADLLHLARHLELDVDEVLDKGRGYYDGDLEHAQDDCAPDCAQRAACPDAGAPGHVLCGTCTIHDRPRHHCGATCTTPPTEEQIG